MDYKMYEYDIATKTISESNIDKYMVQEYDGNVFACGTAINRYDCNETDIFDSIYKCDDGEKIDCFYVQSDFVFFVKSKMQDDILYKPEVYRIRHDGTELEKIYDIPELQYWFQSVRIYVFNNKLYLLRFNDPANFITVMDCAGNEL